MDDIPLPRQIACVEREIRMRKRAYPRWVQFERITQAAADREIAEMEAVLVTLKRLHQPGLLDG